MTSYMVRGNGFKLKQGRVRLYIRRKSFPQRAVMPRHCCPELWVPISGGAPGHGWALGSLSWGAGVGLGAVRALQPNCAEISDTEGDGMCGSRSCRSRMLWGSGKRGDGRIPF